MGTITNTLLNNLRRLGFKRPSNKQQAEKYEDALRQLAVYEKANEPLAAFLRARGGFDEAARGFANPAFGDYYATSVHVHRAVQLRADAVASARLKVYQVNPRTEERLWVGENHPVQKLWDRINPKWSRVQYWRAVETYLSLWGSSYTWMNKPTANPDTWELWPLRPDKVTVVRDLTPGPDNKYIKGYIFDRGGANFAMLPDEVLRDVYFNPLDEFAGLSPIAPARLLIEMQASMLKTNRDLFKNGLLTSNLAFFMKGPLNTDQVEAFYERLANRHAGEGNSNKPIVVDLGLGDAKNLGFSNKDMEFLSGIQLTKDFILTVYGVPEEMIPGSQHATFSNRTEARKEFYESTITQEWTLLEGNVQENFVPLLPGQFQKLITEFARDDVLALQENINARSERQLKEVTAGVRSVNEYREANGMLPDKAGEVFYQPIAVLPVPVGGNPIKIVAETPPRMIVDAYSWNTPKALTSALRQGPDITDLDRATWETFVRRFDAAEENFHELMDRLFKEQEEDTLRNLNRIIGATRGAEAQGELVRAGGDDIFKPVEWKETFVESGRPLMVVTLENSAIAQVGEFGLGISFEVSQATTQAWLDARAVFWADRVNAETSKLIVEEIRIGLSEGESIRALQGRVEKVFQFNSQVRSELIARTEAVASSNEGHLDAYRQADVPRKRWLATLDDRTRDTHIAAHGQTVDRDQSFLVGGAEMIMPGQGPVQEVVNCRCTTLPVFAKDE